MFYIFHSFSWVWHPLKLFKLLIRQMKFAFNILEKTIYTYLYIIVEILMESFIKICSRYIFTITLTSTALTSRGLSIFFWMPYFSRILFRTFSLSISSLSCLSCLCLVYARLASSLKNIGTHQKIHWGLYIVRKIIPYNFNIFISSDISLSYWIKVMFLRHWGLLKLWMNT